VKLLILFIVLIFLFGCKNSSLKISDIDSYKMHYDISTIVFWIGQDTNSVQNISHKTSAWDNMWMLNYNGIDNPKSRNSWYPSGFKPKENPFYFALPYDDFDNNGNKKTDIFSYISWADNSSDKNKSICKNRWAKIIKNDAVVYAQWEDVGPFGKDDKEYVFGYKKPKSSVGLEVSPAVRDYLGLDDSDIVNWQFVDEKDVPDGPWRDIITTSGVSLTDWYKPDINTSWQWQLQGKINTKYNVDMYDVDLFDVDESLIKSLKSDGKKVICYFSAGSYENWRNDKDSFPISVLGNNLDGWEGEKWLDVSNEALLPIMKARLDLALRKGCDGVEPDNVDGYANNTGFGLTADEQLSYNKFIANESRKRGLSVGLKNDVEQIKELEMYYDFSVNEECHEYSECKQMQPFIDANKPVFNVEYKKSKSERDKICANSNKLKFKTLFLPLDLDDSFRYSCD